MQSDLVVPPSLSSTVQHGRFAVTDSFCGILPSNLGHKLLGKIIFSASFSHALESHSIARSGFCVVASDDFHLKWRYVSMRQRIKKPSNHNDTRESYRYQINTVIRSTTNEPVTNSIKTGRQETIGNDDYNQTGCKIPISCPPSAVWHDGRLVKRSTSIVGKSTG